MIKRDLVRLMYFGVLHKLCTTAVSSNEHGTLSFSATASPLPLLLILRSFLVAGIFIL